VKRLCGIEEDGKENVGPGLIAEGPGFEPGTTESESAVLPLNYPSRTMGILSKEVVEGKLRGRFVG
jgi:hypothetical protein